MPRRVSSAHRHRRRQARRPHRHAQPPQNALLNATIGARHNVRLAMQGCAGWVTTEAPEMDATQKYRSTNIISWTNPPAELVAKMNTQRNAERKPGFDSEGKTLDYDNN